MCEVVREVAAVVAVVAFMVAFSIFTALSTHLGHSSRNQNGGCQVNPFALLVSKLFKPRVDPAPAPEDGAAEASRDDARAEYVRAMVEAGADTWLIARNMPGGPVSRSSTYYLMRKHGIQTPRARKAELRSTAIEAEASHGA